MQLSIMTVFVVTLLCSREVKGQTTTEATTTTTTTAATTTTTTTTTNATTTATTTTTTTTSTTTLPLWTEAETGCPPPWQRFAIIGLYSAGSLVSSNSIVYQCKQDVYAACSAWEPGVDTAPWDLVWTVLGSCVGERTTNEPTDAPTTGSPTAAPITGSPTWVLKGCPPEWVGGNGYNGGDVVSHSVNGEESNKRAYKCNSLYQIFCEMYEPNSDEFDSSLVWVDQGACVATLVVTPTLAPVLPDWGGGPCYSEWVEYTNYEAGAFVSRSTGGGDGATKAMFQCKVEPQGIYPYCSVFDPADTPVSDIAWDLKGSCTGERTPTLAPQQAVWPDTVCAQLWSNTGDASYVFGDVVSVMPEGSNEGKVYECKDPMYCMSISPDNEIYGELGWQSLGRCIGAPPSPTTTSAPPPPPLSGCGVEAFNPETTYLPGNTTAAMDVAANTAHVFECKAYPLSLYCSMVGFEPGGEYSQMAWTKISGC